ncbi:MAG: MotA/TolQ/ExbB proton channel family protein [Methylococcaceae bacterium]|jgi:biopolymer transport protein ExbB|nr:MotA/TolQ/ExbB proton channel family protein [Methylococcaceae bacterium]MDP2392999.1 MotA/TolQ/ExbB proton channel family protein [Methylococcaceae bacterium]MDP3020483.1 MotA/TolQ/ExbB proton channel family protein [Methylococcaceae bacterium]MDP3389846.1 MotA/TolQ/ExbB proton channel family protein [Methylococcaceae bacterium]MDP3932891.1 MotA/TolQ/ExbB proton channel family protein [Methylococcaceae bacterium]
MKNLFVFIIALLISQEVMAEPLDLDKLLAEVKQSQGQAGKIDAQKEAQFLADPDKQKQLLEAARAELAKQEVDNNQLKAKLNANAEQLKQLEEKLAERSGGLGELFGVAKQVAGDLKADLNNSLISAQFVGRTAVLAEIADSKALPTMVQLEQLWFTLQQEMTESGKVVYYDGQVLSAAGEPRQTKIVRVGAFNAMADGQYLRYLPETGKLSDLPRQPENHYLDLAEELAETSSGQAAVAIDPTRGAMLGMLIQTPDFNERIQQGGLIGYITLTLGALGFIYGLVRLVQLSVIGNKMTAQIQSTKINEDNPLGRLFAVAEKSSTEASDNLDLLLDEAITREVPELEKGLSLIKLTAAVGPLLGLLGTVTGMIVTFQSISLFGTGDPKLMAEGISQALVTTVEGLCVAIPLLFLHSVVASRSRVLVQILDEQTAGLISRRAGK